MHQNANETLRTRARRRCAGRSPGQRKEIGGLDEGGISHHTDDMPPSPKQQKQKPQVVDEYDVAADSKKRISLRHPKTKYFRVRALSNGAYVLEPRVLVSPDTVSPKVLKMLDQSAENFKKGIVSAPIDLTPFRKE